MIVYILNKIKLNYNHYFALSQRTKTIFGYYIMVPSNYFFVSVYIWPKIQIELRISFVFASG